MRTVVLSLTSLAALSGACRPTAPEASAPAASEQVARPGSAPAAAGPHSGSGAPTAPAFAAIEGTLRLGPGLGADAVRPTDVIFVMARTKSGALVATDIIENVSLPATFRLDGSNLMAHGAGTEPPYQLSARLDRDRDAMTRGADDLYALNAASLTGGETGVELVLVERPADAAHGGAASPPAGEARMPNDAIHGGAAIPKDAIRGGASSQPAGH